MRGGRELARVVDATKGGNRQADARSCKRREWPQKTRKGTETGAKKGETSRANELSNLLGRCSWASYPPLVFVAFRVFCGQFLRRMSVKCPEQDLNLYPVTRTSS